MDFSLTEAQERLKEQIRVFARDELPKDPGLRERDRDATFNRAAWEACAAQGILAANVAEEYGGREEGALNTVIRMEALGYGCRDNGLTLGLGGQIWSIQEPIEVYGSEEQKKKYLPLLCSGQWIGSHGVSEETSGSDALSLKCSAEKRGGEYVINGRKTYIGMAPECDLALVLANSNPSMGKWGVSAFLVEKGTPGFSLGPKRSKMGTRTNPLGDLILKDCVVSESQRLGAEGIGLSLFTRTINWERAFIHAGHLGAMDRLLEECIDYAKNRTQFNQPIGKFQSVSHRIAEMKLRQETSRLLMYKTAALKDKGEEAALECAMTKLQVSESLAQSSMDAVRIHGARGYLEEFEIERDLRDHVGGVIYAGTSDIQRNLIASLLGL